MSNHSEILFVLIIAALSRLAWWAGITGEVKTVRGKRIE